MKSTKKIVPNQYVPSTYDKEKHPQLLIELFTDGKDVADFCAELNLGKTTFFTWLKVHPELADAYEIAKMKAEKWLSEKGRIGMGADHFQFNVWSLLMRNRCKATEHRTVPIDFSKCKSSDDKVKILEKELADGNLTPMEAKCFADVIKLGAEVHEKTEIVKQVDELMELAGKK